MFPMLSLLFRLQTKKQEETEVKTEEYFKKITKDDSRKERREKLNCSFQRNNVEMVSDKRQWPYWQRVGSLWTLSRFRCVFLFFFFLEIWSHHVSYVSCLMCQFFCLCGVCKGSGRGGFTQGRRRWWCRWHGRGFVGDSTNLWTKCYSPQLLHHMPISL